MPRANTSPRGDSSPSGDRASESASTRDTSGNNINGCPAPVGTAYADMTEEEQRGVQVLADMYRVVNGDIVHPRSRPPVHPAPSMTGADSQGDPSMPGHRLPFLTGGNMLGTGGPVQDAFVAPASRTRIGGLSPHLTEDGGPSDEEQMERGGENGAQLRNGDDAVNGWMVGQHRLQFRPVQRPQTRWGPVADGVQQDGDRTNDQLTNGVNHDQAASPHANGTEMPTAPSTVFQLRDGNDAVNGWMVGQHRLQFRPVQRPQTQWGPVADGVQQDGDRTIDQLTNGVNDHQAAPAGTYQLPRLVLPPGPQNRILPSIEDMLRTPPPYPGLAANTPQTTTPETVHGQRELARRMREAMDEDMTPSTAPSAMASHSQRVNGVAVTHGVRHGSASDELPWNAQLRPPTEQARHGYEGGSTRRNNVSAMSRNESARVVDGDAGATRASAAASNGRGTSSSPSSGTVDVRAFSRNIPGLFVRREALNDGVAADGGRNGHVRGTGDE